MKFLDSLFAWGDLKNQFKKNHALAQSLLSRLFSWDVGDVRFPSYLIMP
jgi:hypothetical protein